MNREQFEEKFPAPLDALYREDWDCYVYTGYTNTAHHQYNMLWCVWRDSRSCIEVELPRAYRDDFKGWVISERGTIDALKAQGIKVKQ